MSFAPDAERAAGPFLAPNRLIPRAGVTGLPQVAAWFPGVQVGPRSSEDLTAVRSQVLFVITGFLR